MGIFSLVSLVSAAILGIFAFHFTTHPKSKVRQRLPAVRLKNLQIFPEIRIHVRGRIIHFHHWFNFSVLLIISIFVSSSILDAMFTRGFLLGGIIQGLLLPRRRLIYKQDSRPQKKKLKR